MDDITKEKLKESFNIWIKRQNIKKIDTNEVKQAIEEELNFFSTLNVKEYILFYKWQKLQEMYPNKSNSFFNMSILQQYPEIKKIKENIWIPKDPNDYLNIEPELIYCDTKDLGNEWTILRHFISTMNYNGLVGRRLNFIVKDKITKRYLGVFTLSSDFLDLTPRDKFIGWDRKIKTYEMINHTGIGSTIVPTQPLGYNYLGGKFIALMIISNIVENTWNKKYKDKLAGITTTSLYGSFSQYNSLKYWKKLGKTNGTTNYLHTKKITILIKNYLKYNEPEYYHKALVFKHPNGTGPFFRDGTQRSVAHVYSNLNIKKATKTKHQRGIYFCNLYNNTNEFLRKDDKELKKHKFDNSIEALTILWKERYAKKRITKLIENKKYNNNILFYDGLLELNTWEDVKKKYLSDVGR